ncbi:DUF3853 family protein [Carboxylicivirga mesophila]|uniref:DUF3853 family protein n=2 Tax=Carboxylicivirga TaxID=1628153 RepID=A0A941F3I1_9BACT|nr:MULTISPECIES: DUF3853 family protein [Carboxylicivirga]MBR8536096.1 DUF3853 family protein [Carboxylicivirga sediminis]MBS2210774.1 DUF3853 family protein [Carboxylicivirga mesophila]
MYNDETPIVMLTVGELKALIGQRAEVELKQESFINNEEKSYVYGLSGIRRLFNVSHATAQRYKDTILKDAVMQNGRKIIVDKNKAIELFNQCRGR